MILWAGGISAERFECGNTSILQRVMRTMRNYLCSWGIRQCGVDFLCVGTLELLFLICHVGAPGHPRRGLYKSRTEGTSHLRGV